MEPQIARAFLVRSLNSVQLQSLRNFERSQPVGRYLTAFEIIRDFHIRPEKLVEEQQEGQMVTLWREFQKTLWKQRQIEELRHDVSSKEFQGRTYQEEMHQWEDYAIENYSDASFSALNY